MASSGNAGVQHSLLWHLVGLPLLSTPPLQARWVWRLLWQVVAAARSAERPSFGWLDVSGNNYALSLKEKEREREE